MVNLDIKEVGRVLNYFNCFVPTSRMDEFEEEAMNIQNGYNNEVKKIDEYESNEYEKIVKRGEVLKHLEDTAKPTMVDELIKLGKACARNHPIRELNDMAKNARGRE